MEASKTIKEMCLFEEDCMYLPEATVLGGSVSSAVSFP
jgi:hypothetical protein